MTTINIIINSVYACHVAYMAYLLKLTVNVVTPLSNITFNFADEYQLYYQRMVDKLYEDTGFVLETTFFEHFIKNNLNIVSSSSHADYTITITNSTSLIAAEQNLLTHLHNLAIITDLNEYTSNSHFVSYRNTIKWSIEFFFNRAADNSEIDYYYLHNGLGLYDPSHPKFTNLFTWLHVLYFCTEGRNKGLHLPLVNAFRHVKYTYQLQNPTFALILSGHSREFIQHSQTHKAFIENPYIDVFIHTWTRKGPRYEYVEASIDVTELTSVYNPCKILVEDEHLYKNDFSFKGKISPIFLMWGQQGDDATRYVNSKLYSTWKAMHLIEQYELEKGITYNAIIKFNFNVNIESFDFRSMIEDVTPNIIGQAKNALYVPDKYFNRFNPQQHPYTGGGCQKCDQEVKYFLYTYIPNHPQHMNDICEAWWYANRTVGKKATDLYENTLQIMMNNHTNNVANYVNGHYRQYQDFIYVQQPVHYQAKVYDVDNLNRRVVCFYPERLMREHMVNYPIVSSNRIKGIVKVFDALSHKV